MSDKIVIPTDGTCAAITIERFQNSSVTITQQSFTGRTRKVIYLTAKQWLIMRSLDGMRSLDNG